MGLAAQVQPANMGKQNLYYIGLAVVFKLGANGKPVLHGMAVHCHANVQPAEFCIANFQVLAVPRSPAAGPPPTFFFWPSARA